MEYELIEVLDKFFDSRMDEVHTAFPGIIEVYDGHDKRTATVRPAVNFMLSNGAVIDPPAISDVPVMIPFVNAGGLLFPIEKGDKVLMVVSECALGKWLYGKGEILDVEDPTKFTMHDAVCIPGLYPKSTAPKVSGADPGDVWLGLLGKGSFRCAKDGTIEIKNSKSSMKAELEAIWDAIKLLNDNIQQLSVPYPAGGPVTNLPAFVQGSVQASSNKSKVGTFLK